MKEIKDLKIQDFAKMQTLDAVELKKELNLAEKKYFALKMQKQLWELKQTHLITFMRKYIARIQTLIIAKRFIG
jgi:ribosomal protein L29